MAQITAINYGSFTACTPSDTALVSCRAIYVGGAGNITLSKDATTAGVLITAPPVGSILPLSVEQGRVMATGTTATGLILLY